VKPYIIDAGALYWQKHMRSVYRGKSDKLNELQSRVVTFFTAKGFKANIKENVSGTVISVNGPNSVKILDVCLVSEPDSSLLVSFERVEESLILRNSPFPALLGAGILTLKSQKSAEILENLEKEFWRMIDEFVTLP